MPIAQSADHAVHRVVDVPRLLTELPGILNWSITGWRRLNERGHFRQPPSAAEAVRDLEDLGSPIGAFIRDRCYVNPSRSVSITRLFEVWCEWCKEQGRESQSPSILPCSMRSTTTSASIPK